MKITKRQLRRIIREAFLREQYDYDNGSEKRDTSAEGSFSAEWEKVQVYMPGIGEGTNAYQYAGSDQIDVDDLVSWLNQDEPGEELTELGVADWDEDDREALRVNIEKAIEDGEEQGQSW